MRDLGAPRPGRVYSSALASPLMVKGAVREPQLSGASAHSLLTAVVAPVRAAESAELRRPCSCCASTAPSGRRRPNTCRPLAGARGAQERAQLVVLQIDTPGGLDTSMRSIIRTSSLRRCRWPPIVAPQGARAAAPAPTSSTRRTSRRWRPPPTSAPRRRSRSACPIAGRRAGARRSSRRAPPRHSEAGHDTSSRQAHQRRRRLHPQPGPAARPRRRVGRAGGARVGQPSRRATRSPARSSTSSPST